jgi:hypothetical protein
MMLVVETLTYDLLFEERVENDPGGTSVLHPLYAVDLC